MTIFEEEFEKFFKTEVKKHFETIDFKLYRLVKNLCKKTYFQGRFDESNYIGACLKDSIEKSRKAEFEKE